MTPRIRPTPRRTPRATSPTVASVRTQADADALVARVRSSGAPLVEPVSGDGSVVLATFVWQGSAGTGRVALDAAGLTDRDWFADSILEPVAGTDLLTATLRVRSDWRGAYGFAVGVDGDPPSELAGSDRRRRWWLDVMAGSVADPLSLSPVHTTSWGAARSEGAMPAAPSQRWWDAGGALARADLAAAVVEDRVSLCGIERSVWVCAPGRHEEPRGLVVVFDGATWVDRMPIGPSLVALDASGATRPFVVVMVDSVAPDVRSRELTADPAFRRSICDELVPWVRARHDVVADPATTIAAGQSFGGLAAVDLALAAPEVFGGAVVQSGSFWWPVGELASTDARAHWAERLRDAPPGMRLWMDAGLLEGDMHHLTRQFVADARGAGVDVVHREHAGAHDPVQWREGLVEGIAALMSRTGGGGRAR